VVVVKQGVGPMTYAEVEDDLLRHVRRLAQGRGTAPGSPRSGRPG
jgi:hypothetical protein